jgi:hypothetical protein
MSKTKYVEKVPLTAEEHAEFKERTKNGLKMRKTTAGLIRTYLKEEKVKDQHTKK